MNDHDKGNLEFILSLDYDEFDQWMETLDEDDMQYAIDLIRRGRQELLEQYVDLTVNSEHPELKDARQVIDRIRKM